jgi:diguanylate cyclase (GGDEF)-like protein
MARARLQPFQRSLLVDGAILALGATALFAVAFDVVLTAIGHDPGPVIVAYPVGAVCLLGFGAWIAVLTGRRPDRALGTALTGLALAAATGLAFAVLGSLESSSPDLLLGAGWFAGSLLVGMAVLQEARPVQVALDGPSRLTTTTVAAVCALAVLGFSAVVSFDPVAAAVAAGSIVALIVRSRFSFRENIESFAQARQEAHTDSLTGLGNRRKLIGDLHRELRVATARSPRVLVLFDLDGFKRYNDTYGHPAGDVLLTRLGANLGRAIGPYGDGYRLGGDEFCVLVTRGGAAAKTVIGLAAAALSDHGEGFAVKSSYGAVMLPHEARDAAAALKVADQRMYAHKESRRASAGRQTRDILLQVLTERSPDIGVHIQEVAVLARGVAARLSLEAEDLNEVVRAAELHDIGKMAVPDEVLHKPGPLTEEEWDFIRQHTIVGERILSAAPALTPVAKMVRASHEHWDGSGYPDGLAGREIPLGARIVAVCDAFDTMTSDRPYRAPLPVDEALAELRRCAGGQFDPEVVKAFCDELATLALRERAVSAR